MRMKPLGMVVMTAVLAAIAIAAVALGPANLANLNAPPGGNTPESSIGAPTWHEGDSWTYDVNASSPIVDSGTYWEAPHVAGTFTRTVESADSSQYNVSVHGSFHVAGLFDPVRDGFGNASIMVLISPFLENATVDGYSVYRASDLAELMEVRTVRLSGSLWTEHGTFNATYTAKVETTYDPPLDVWSFPIDENETWNVSSNATIRAWITWSWEGPNESFGFWHNFTVEVPVQLMLESGVFEDVTTPAGTFSSIPVRLKLPTIDHITMDDRMGPILGLGSDACGEPRLSVEAWFSGDVGNVVKAVSVVGGTKVVTELMSYHRS